MIHKFYLNLFKFLLVTRRLRKKRIKHSHILLHLSDRRMFWSLYAFLASIMYMRPVDSIIFSLSKERYANESPAHSPTAASSNNLGKNHFHLGAFSIAIVLLHSLCTSWITCRKRYAAHILATNHSNVASLAPLGSP